jgi:hypothetical protein
LKAELWSLEIPLGYTRLLLPRMAEEGSPKGVRNFSEARMSQLFTSVVFLFKDAVGVLLDKIVMRDLGAWGLATVSQLEVI